MTILEIRERIERQKREIDHSTRLLCIDSRYYFPQIANLRYAIRQLNHLVDMLEKASAA